MSRRTLTGWTVGTLLGAFAALGAGHYDGWGLLQWFGRMGLDWSTSIHEAVSTPSGGIAFPFATGEGDSLVGWWERRVPDVYGELAGTVYAWPDSVTTDSLRFPAAVLDGDSIQAPIYQAGAPWSIRLACRVDGFNLSGLTRLMFYGYTRPDCIPEVEREDVPDGDGASRYTVRIFHTAEDSAQTRTLVLDDEVRELEANTVTLAPGRFSVFWAAFDSLGFRTQWLGPVEFRVNY